MSAIRRLIVLFAFASLASLGCSHHDKNAAPAAQAPDTTSGAERATEAPTPPPIEEPPPPGSSATPSEAERATETSGREPTAPLSDDQIVRILNTVDSGEIEQAQLAAQKAEDPRVKKFAQQMIDQHSKSKQKTLELTKKQQLLPANSAVASDLTDTGSRVLDALNSVTGPDFDKTYIGAQVDQHQAALDLLKSRLVPNASDPQLAAQLWDTKKMVEKHLAQAKQIQTQMQR